VNNKRLPPIFKIKGLFCMSADQAAKVTDEIADAYRLAIDTGKPLVFGDGVEIVFPPDEWEYDVGDCCLTSLARMIRERLDRGWEVDKMSDGVVVFRRRIYSLSASTDSGSGSSGGSSSGGA
jgi:uncharacterized membrane protein YgcG